MARRSNDARRQEQLDFEFRKLELESVVRRNDRPLILDPFHGCMACIAYHHLVTAQIKASITTLQWISILFSSILLNNTFRMNLQAFSKCALMSSPGLSCTGTFKYSNSSGNFGSLRVAFMMYPMPSCCNLNALLASSSSPRYMFLVIGDGWSKSGLQHKKSNSERWIRLGNLFFGSVNSGVKSLPYMFGRRPPYSLSAYSLYGFTFFRFLPISHTVAWCGAQARPHVRRCDQKPMIPVTKW